MTSAGRFTRAMTFAIVNVLPEPVTPSRTWCASAALEPLDQLGDRAGLIAAQFEIRDQIESVHHAPGDCLYGLSGA